MSYDTFSLIKSQAKSLSRDKSIKLAHAQENIAKSHSFASYHELVTVYKKNPSDHRFMIAAFGIDSFSEAIYEDNIYADLESLVEKALSSDTAETNAYGYTIENEEITDHSYDEKRGELMLKISFEYIGEQDSDKGHHGSQFAVDANVFLIRRANTWLFSDDPDLEIERCLNERELFHEQEETPTNKPQCEVCGENEAYSFSAMQYPLSDWKLTCSCTKHDEHYYVMFDRFESNGYKATLQHLLEKRDMDAASFSQAIKRYEDPSYKKLTEMMATRLLKGTIGDNSGPTPQF